MKNKISSIFLFILITLFAKDLSAQNWFPLEVGNEWQYLIFHNGSSLFENHIEYMLFTYSIDKDTLIADTKFYSWSKYRDFWTRYSNSDSSIFVWWNDSDNVFMDFKLPAQTSFDRFEPYLFSYISSLVIDGFFEFNNQNYLAKGYEGYESFTLPEIWARNYFASDLGWIYHYEEGSNIGGGISWIQENKLIQANINGINYSENYDPGITIEPITAVSDSIFHLVFEVNHEYNHVFPDSTPNTSLNFIDTVKMHSYYSKDSTIVQNPVIYAESISGTEQWEINTFLNINLMMNDYEFNYRIEAVDKGLVPHRSFAPDSGYFIAAYDTTTDVISLEDPITSFGLFQNYPNPFNPTTNIEFRITEFGLTTLRVYDVLGKEITTLVNEEKPAGSYEVEFSAANLPSGVYFYKLQAGSFVETKKMVLLR